MKFEKILILVYLLFQCLLYICITKVATIIAPYIVATVFTLAFYLATAVKNPGFLVVEDIKIEEEEKGKNTSKPHNDGTPNSEEEPPYTPKNFLQTNIAADCGEQIQHRIEPIAEKNNIEHLGLKPAKSAIKYEKHCGICLINQPFRTKHCHECEQCVATCDHHCPWMGNCIGEKNRHIFILFLISQSVQIFIATIFVWMKVSRSIFTPPGEYILGVFLIITFLACLGLTIFHFYLMLVNITTWEISKWESIYYLSDKERKEGSPFSKGAARNVMEFWTWGFRKTRKMWEFEK